MSVGLKTALPLAPPPKTPLARYRLLSPSASVRVSPLCLGAMNFGDAWKTWLGECNEATTEDILDFFFEQVCFGVDNSLSKGANTHKLPGNFIDTSNNYQFQESETRIGDWMAKRGNRDQMVIATKYTTNYKLGPHQPSIMANYTGNGTKSLFTSVNASLRKLQTDYIDLLYVHWWDYSTSIPELMQSLNQLVTSGKVLYLGVSDTPAWVVSKANEYARNHGLRQFCVYQGRWSAASRDLERDIIPMCKAEGMGICPWGPLGGGNFKTEQQRQSSDRRRNDFTEKDIQVSKVLEGIADRKGTVLTSIALAYVMHKASYVFPIVGGRKVEHLKGNIEALTITLSDEEIKEIDSAIPFDFGFPHNFLWGGASPENPQQVWLLNMAGAFDYVPEQQPIKPRQKGE